MNETVTLDLTPGGVVLVVGDCRYDPATTEAIRRAVLKQQLGETLEPHWRDRRDDSYRPCEGSGERVRVLPGVTEAWCTICQTHVPVGGGHVGGGVRWLASHTRRVEAMPA